MSRLLILPLLALAACATPSEELLATDANVSVAYRQGFDDGCHSGRQAAGSAFDQFRKDLSRFNTDRDYALGWSDAYRQCETKEEALQRQIRSAQTIAAINASQEDQFDRVLSDIDYSGLEGFGN